MEDQIAEEVIDPELLVKFFDLKNLKRFYPDTKNIKQDNDEIEKNIQECDFFYKFQKTRQSVNLTKEKIRKVEEEFVQNFLPLKIIYKIYWELKKLIRELGDAPEEPKAPLSTRFQKNDFSNTAAFFRNNPQFTSKDLMGVFEIVEKKLNSLLKQGDTYGCNFSDFKNKANANINPSYLAFTSFPEEKKNLITDYYCNKKNKIPLPSFLYALRNFIFRYLMYPEEISCYTDKDLIWFMGFKKELWDKSEDNEIGSEDFLREIYQLNKKLKISIVETIGFYDLLAHLKIEKEEI